MPGCFRFCCRATLLQTPLTVSKCRPSHLQFREPRSRKICTRRSEAVDERRRYADLTDRSMLSRLIYCAPAAVTGGKTLMVWQRPISHSLIRILDPGIKAYAP